MRNSFTYIHLQPDTWKVESFNVEVQDDTFGFLSLKKNLIVVAIRGYNTFPPTYME